MEARRPWRYRLDGLMTQCERQILTGRTGGGDFGGIDFSKLGGGAGMPTGDEEEEESDDEDMPPLEGEEEEKDKAEAEKKPAA